MAAQFFKGTQSQASWIEQQLSQYFNVVPSSITVTFRGNTDNYIVKESENVAKVRIVCFCRLDKIVEFDHFWAERPSVYWFPSEYPWCKFEGRTSNDWAPDCQVLALDAVFVFRAHTMWYKNYLQSPIWIEKRNEALRLSKYRCSRCGVSEHLNVHHLNYNNIGGESQSDLFVCCRNCHQLFHN